MRTHRSRIALLSTCLLWTGLLWTCLLSTGCSIIVPSSGDFTYGGDAARPDAAIPDAGTSDAGCPMMCDGVCRDTNRDPMYCGSCDRVCSAPANGTAVCNDARCDFTCESGYDRVVGTCVERDAPRPIAPLSTARVTSRRPTLRWELAPRSDGARVELCEDRACTTVLRTIDAPGTSVRPPEELPTGVVFWRLFSLNEGEAAAIASPTWQFYVPARSADGDVDTSWGHTTDFNGDGFTDLAVLRPGDLEGGATDYLEIQVYAGSGAGPAGPVATINNVWELAPAGDVNGDGYPDLLTRGGDDPPLRLHLGSETGVVASTIGFDGSNAVAAGDVDGDGFADILVQVPLDEEPFHSRVLLYRGDPSAPRLPTEFARVSSLFGGVGSLGDVNGDGFGDVWVRNVEPANTVQVLLGSSTGLRPSVVLAAPSSYFGGVGCVADLNGDGYADAASAAQATARGATYVFYGGATGPGPAPSVTLVTAANGDVWQAACGDINGDGYDDLAITETPRMLHVYLGGVALPSSPSSTLPLETEPFVIRLCDLDGDHLAEVVVGLPTVDDFNGRVDVYPGTAGGTGSLPTSLSMPGPNRPQFGYRIALLPVHRRSQAEAWLLPRGVSSSAFGERG